MAFKYEKTKPVKTNLFKIAQCGIGKHHGLKHVQAYFALSTDIAKKKKKRQKITWRDSKWQTIQSKDIIIDMFSNHVGPLIHPPAEQTHKRQYLFGS